MNDTDKTSAFWTAMVAARAEMKNATKNAQNPHLKNKYANLEAILESVNPVLVKHGLTFIQIPTATDKANHVALTTIVGHTSGAEYHFHSELPVAKYDAQGAGGGYTYLRRYTLSALFGITQEDDDGETAVGRTRPRKERKAAVDLTVLDRAKTAAELDALANALVDQGADEEQVEIAHAAVLARIGG